jgi:hypothetical protein
MMAMTPLSSPGRLLPLAVVQLMTIPPFTAVARSARVFRSPTLRAFVDRFLSLRAGVLVFIAALPVEVEHRAA